MFGKTLLGMIFGSVPVNPATLVPEIQPQFQMRTHIVYHFDGKTGEVVASVQPVENHRRLKSRGKGGKQAHTFTGIAAARRAARKARKAH